ncbi:mariner Mos1 transposase [Trichonephila clavipes]|nr:mariner Mos1 transposase [Trichonephila clavipes]
MKESSGRPQKCENEHLLVLLDDDPTQTQQKLAKSLNVSQETMRKHLRATGKINKLGKWVPHDLSEHQMENRKVTCEMLLQRHERKSYLYRIVTGDEKWIYFENPKWKKSWLSSGEAASSTPRPNRFGKMAMLCVWWDQSGIVYYEPRIDRKMTTMSQNTR